MDPSAPKDDQQASDGNENQQSSPIQSGQFVVSGEPGAAPSINDPPETSSPSSNQTQPPAPGPTPSQPNQTTDLQSDLKSTVEAATGTNLAGVSSFQPQGSSGVKLENPTLDPSSGKSANQQPDPTPFTPPNQSPIQGPGPTAPSGSPSPAQDQQDSGSPTGKFKSVIIFAAIFILVAIIAAVAWFFILNRNSSQQTTTSSSPTTQVELNIPSPTPRTSGGFGDIPSSTAESAATQEAE